MHQPNQMINKQFSAPVSPLSIGQISITGNAILAPMSGITDMPFRKLAQALGAPLVVTDGLVQFDYGFRHNGRTDLA